MPDQEQANKQTKQTKRGEKKKQQPRELVAILFVCIRNEQSVTVIEWVFSARASFHLSRCVDKKNSGYLCRERVALVLSAVSGRRAAQNYFSNFLRIIFGRQPRCRIAVFRLLFRTIFKLVSPREMWLATRAHTFAPLASAKSSKNPIRMRMRQNGRKEKKKKALLQRIHLIRIENTPTHAAARRWRDEWTRTLFRCIPRP